MVIVKMVNKYNKYNVGEEVTLDEATARRWCGEESRGFRVAERLPAEVQDARKKALRHSPVNAMIAPADVTKRASELDELRREIEELKQDATRRPGRPAKA